jgi:hypothetical protein
MRSYFLLPPIIAQVAQGPSTSFEKILYPELKFLACDPAYRPAEDDGMRRILKFTVIAGWTMLAPWAARMAASGEPQPKPEFAVKVADYAKVDHATLKKAKLVAASIFARAGVKANLSDWEDCNDVPERSGTFHVIIRDSPESYGLPASVLGVVPRTVNEIDRNFVFVFYKVAIQLGAQTLISSATILGYAMAHVIGHVLLDQPSHSRSGVMKANWTVNDMREMNNTWGLNFDPEQSGRIQAEVRRRMQDQQTKMLASSP